MNIKINWTEFKGLSTSKNVSMQYVESEADYNLFLIDGTFEATCKIFKTDPKNAEQTDFEDNFKANSNKPLVPRDANGREISTSSPFTDASGFRFRGASFKGTCAADSITDIDYKITHERWINGGRALVDNIGEDDQITFQVVDKDNILGFGAGLVLDEFITGYYIPQDGNLEVALAYPARIMAGLYIRIKYTSTHASGCTLKCNLYLHWKSA
jgi:hypothetical protein